MLHMHFSFAIQLSSMNHNELHSFLVGDIRCRAIACKYNVDSLDVFGARMGLATSSLLLAAGAASGTLPLTQFGLLRGLCIGSAAAGLWGAAQGTAIISVQDVQRVLKWNDLKATQQQVRWCDTMQTITAELTATHDEGIYVMHVPQYGDQCVAFGRHHGNTFYIDVHGSKRLPRPGVFLVHFKCIEDLVKHGIKADAKERAAYCRCGQDGCMKCAFMLHTCKSRMPVSVLDVGRTILRDVTTQQIWAAVKEMYPLRPPKHVVTTVDDVDSLLVTLHVGAIDSYWVGIMNERNATAAQDANRTEYNCVCGRPSHVQAVPGNGWYTAHCEQSTAHKAYVSTGHKWVDNRGRKKTTTPTKTGSSKATSINHTLLCIPRLCATR